MPTRNRKNLRKIPDEIRAKLNGFTDADFRVESVRHIAGEEVRQGKWQHLGIELVGQTLNLPTETMPERQQGRYSRYNLDGRTIVRKDLPKISRTYTWDVPNFPPSIDTHEITVTKLVYQRDFLSPQGLTIQMELLREEPVANDEGSAYVIRFTVDEVLNPAQPDLESALLFDLNLLQENVGSVDVFLSSASRADYLANLHVEWELLPVGTREALIARITSRMPRGITEEVRARIQARVDFLHHLQPMRFVQGSSGFNRYFGALFRDDLVVFENLTYGNAAYVLYRNWQDLSQRSRLDLLGGHAGDFDRVVHRSGWQEKLTRILRRHLGDLPPQGNQQAA